MHNTFSLPQSSHANKKILKSFPASFYDPIVGAEIVTAEGKAKYANATVQYEEVELPIPSNSCPFCHEDHEINPRTGVILGIRREPNGRWVSIALDNKYPFDTGEHEIIICNYEHDWDLRTASHESVHTMLSLWEERVEHLREIKHSWVSSWLSYGKAAGQSQPHAHIQMLTFKKPTPTIQSEVNALQKPDCRLCNPGKQSVVVHPNGIQMVLSKPSGYITLSPVEHYKYGLEQQSETIPWVLQALWKVNGPTPYNIIWHTGMTYAEHPHIHILPRSNYIGGIELIEGWRAIPGIWKHKKAEWAIALNSLL